MDCMFDMEVIDNDFVRVNLEDGRLLIISLVTDQVAYYPNLLPEGYSGEVIVDQLFRFFNTSRRFIKYLAENGQVDLSTRQPIQLADNDMVRQVSDSILIKSYAPVIKTSLLPRLQRDKLLSQ